MAALAADPLSLHLEQVATATTPVGQVEAALSGDFSGDDLDLTIQLTTAGEGVDMDMVIVGDTAYARCAATRTGRRCRVMWPKRRSPGSSRTCLVTDPLDLRYVGLEDVDGRELHHLTATLFRMPAAGGTGQYDVFDIWIEEDGTPVLARRRSRRRTRRGLRSRYHELRVLELRRADRDRRARCRRSGQCGRSTYPQIGQLAVPVIGSTSRKLAQPFVRQYGRFDW